MTVLYGGLVGAEPNPATSYSVQSGSDRIVRWAPDQEIGLAHLVTSASSVGYFAVRSVTAGAIIVGAVAVFRCSNLDDGPLRLIETKGVSGYS
ncbi:MAG: hypothetical protein OXN89_19725 [Bryobacterales bacterium]|nr:hypothetical protein [Bryobacterales bacterium]